MHGGKQAHAVQMRISSSSGDTVPGIGLQRIEHEITKEPLRISGDSFRHTSLIAVAARNKARTANVESIQFSDPLSSQTSGFKSRHIPAEQGRKDIDGVQFLLPAQASVEAARKEMNVSIAYRQFTPGSLGHVRLF